MTRNMSTLRAEHTKAEILLTERRSRDIKHSETMENFSHVMKDGYQYEPKSRNMFRHRPDSQRSSKSLKTYPTFWVLKYEHTIALSPTDSYF